MTKMTNFKYIIVLLLSLISLSVAAQCPFSASITITDAGGCGNLNGSVFFTVTPTTPNSINQVYYLVYRTSDNSLVTSSNNTNPEVSLPEGNYRAEVQVQCSNATSQTPWTQNFAINQRTTSSTFSAVYNMSSSRLTSLNAIPSGILAYTLSGSGPYMIDLVEYPDEYTGLLHFDNITNGVFKLEDLAAGSYKVRITNGCMVITDGPRTITNTVSDLPSGSFLSDVRICYEKSDGTLNNRPTKDYNTIYIGLNSSQPLDFWGKPDCYKYYEYGYYYAADGETQANITSWNDFNNTYPIAITNTRYTIKQMVNDNTKVPTIVVRLKNTTTTAEMRPIHYNWNLSTVEYYMEPSTTNCNNVDMRISIVNRNVLTFPLDLQITNYSGSTILKTYTLTEADFDQNYITLNNIDISSGFKYSFICHGDPTTVQATYPIASKNITSYGDLIYLRSNRRQLTNYCESDWCEVYISSGPVLDNAKIKYTGTIPMPDLVQEMTLPSSAGSSPAITKSVSSGLRYVKMQPGIYTWDISIPCGSGYTTYTKSITIAEPLRNKLTTDATKFNPTMGVATQCGSVEIDLGTFDELSDIYVYNNTQKIQTALYLCTLDESNSYYAYYNKLNSSDGVYYDGSDSYFFKTTPANAIYTNPKIRINQPGTYYLLALPDELYNGGLAAGLEELESCHLVKKFVVAAEDFVAELDVDATAAYFCAQDGSTGNIFVKRKGNEGVNEFVFRVWNSSLSYDQTITSTGVEQVFTNIDVATHGNTFNVSVEAANNCTSSPSTTVVVMDEINNSAVFIQQNVSSNCDGSVDLELEAIAYSSTSYEWTDVTGAVLSNTNKLTGKYPTGTKLYLDVTFTPTGPNGQAVECGKWRKEYFIEGTPLTEYYWRRDAVSGDWNNVNNWNDKDGNRATSVPGECSSAFIPAIVNTFYPDLASATNPKVTDIFFEYGAQLYNQHKLQYRNAFISYNTGYYSTLTSPTPTTIVQPDAAINLITPNSDAKAPIAKSSLPIINRGRWYMLAAPLKGMYTGDFQLGTKPFSMIAAYNIIEPNTDPNIYSNQNLAVVPSNNTALSTYYNAFGLWIVPYISALGADDHTVLQNLKGDIKYPYFYPYYLNDEIVNLLPDKSYDRQTSVMDIKQFEIPEIDPSGANQLIRSSQSGRFIYEDDTTNAIPTSNIYTLSIAADNNRDNGEVMIGNPFMCPINFNAFLSNNSALIESKFKILIDGQEVTFPTTTSSDDNLIAPLQSFIITLKNPKAAATLQFPISVMSTQSNTTIGVKVK